MCVENGFRMNLRCVEYASPYPVCLNGDFDNKICISYDTVSPDVICPHGYTLTINEKSAHCEQPYTYTVKAPCPKGTIESGKKCMSKSYVQPSYWCPPETSMHGSWCLMYEKFDCTPEKVPIVSKHKKKHHKKHYRRLGHDDPHIMTSKGKQQISILSKTCEKEIKTPVVKECPPGTFQSGKQCVENHYHERGEIEKTDFHRTNVETICPTSYDWCHTGSKKHHDKNDLCCVRKTEEPIWECPAGFEHSDHGCVRYHRPIHICPSEKGKKHHHHSDHLESGKACGKWDYAEAIRTFTVVVEEPHHKKKHHY